MFSFSGIIEKMMPSLLRPDQLGREGAMRMYLQEPTRDVGDRKSMSVLEVSVLKKMEE